MRYELRRRLETIARTLATLGARDNARALARRIHDGTAVEWLRGEHGEHVWAEIGGALEQAHRVRGFLPLELAAAAVDGEHAYGEAEPLLATELPRPARVPFLRVIVGGAAATQPPRAA